MRFALLSLSLLWSQLFKANGLRQADSVSSSNQQRVMMLGELAMNGGSFDTEGLSSMGGQYDSGIIIWEN
jgi:deoxyxylulose-5-phosphate synthase